MKRFLKKRFLGIPLFAILAVVLVGTVALAAWGITELTSTGTITVTEAPPEYTYELDTTVLVFGDTTVEEGKPISVTSSLVTVTNTGDVTINGIDFAFSGVPEGLTATGLCSPATLGPHVCKAKVSVTLTGTAAAYPHTYDLTEITVTLTPH